AAARPGVLIGIVSADRAFDAVGDVAASLGIEFRRLSYRRLKEGAGETAAEPEDRPLAMSPSGSRRRRRRRGRGPGGPPPVHEGERRPADSRGGHRPGPGPGSQPGGRGPAAPPPRPPPPPPAPPTPAPPGTRGS